MTTHDRRFGDKIMEKTTAGEVLVGVAGSVGGGRGLGDERGRRGLERKEGWRLCRGKDDDWNG